MDRIDADTHAGQAIYAPAVLAVYDFWVLGVSNHVLWRCPTRELRALYDRNVAARHADIGVGTGYFLDHARWPVARPDITLIDLNRQSLAAAARRIRRFAPEQVAADALQPLALDRSFGSAGLCYLLHCLPGRIQDKAVVLDHAAKLVIPGGRVFGATIVQGSAPRSLPAQVLMNAYNARGIFSNAADTIEALDAAMSSRFESYRLRRIGCVAIFEATVPR